MIGFGVFGYLGRKFHFEMAPLILALVIGPMMGTESTPLIGDFPGQPLDFCRASYICVVHWHLSILSDLSVDSLDRGEAQKTTGKGRR